MPTSNDNQDFGKGDEKSKEKNGQASSENKLTSDDLKGKKVDADPENESGKPMEQKK